MKNLLILALAACLVAGCKKTAETPSITARTSTFTANVQLAGAFKNHETLSSTSSFKIEATDKATVGLIGYWDMFKNIRVDLNTTDKALTTKEYDVSGSASGNNPSYFYLGTWPELSTAASLDVAGTFLLRQLPFDHSKVIITNITTDVGKNATYTYYDGTYEITFAEVNNATGGLNNTTATVTGTFTNARFQ